MKATRLSILALMALLATSCELDELPTGASADHDQHDGERPPGQPGAERRVGGGDASPDPDTSVSTPATTTPTTHPESTPATTTPTTTTTTTHPESTPATTTPTTTTTVPSPATPPPAGNLVFFEDFASGGSLGRFEFDIYHRDDNLVGTTTWLGDHAVTGPNDLCGPPEDKRVITRGDRSSDFNDDWIYRCVPGGDTAKAHLMTSIGDTSGYSIGSFAPTQVFNNVREVRWDINITELGDRQFPEVKIIPVNTFDFQNIPCALEWLPCETDTHGQLGSVGTSFFNHTPLINNGTQDLDGTQWQKANPNDPALTSIRTRRQHFFRDNNNGTLTLGIERENGTFSEFTTPGSFPSGPVRVVFADHNYTPDKEGTPIGHTWHWDNLAIYE